MRVEYVAFRIDNILTRNLRDVAIVLKTENNSYVEMLRRDEAAAIALKYPESVWNKVAQLPTLVWWDDAGWHILLPQKEDNNTWM